MKQFRSIVCLLVGFIIMTPISAQLSTYSKVKVFYENPSEIERLAGLELDIDHPEFLDGNSIALFVNSEEIDKLKEQGFKFEIIIEDFRAYYADKIAGDKSATVNMHRTGNVADGFDLGTMGGFYTFAEVEAKLDEMVINYPDLVSQKSSIGTSIEGRPIWMVKISDNPNVNEPEPAAYFDGLHHAREPLSMAVNINYMFWLLENYDTDPAVRFLVDNRELYFVPVVNPDGYVYNQQTDPEGGGLWRKNRRLDPGGCVGVDLNRNYSFGYANNNSCSSTDPCSGVYRGTSAFSEPETLAVSNFLAQIQPKTAFSIHSTAGSYLMPYGYDTTPPDFEIYSEWASAFLNENDYPYGVTFQMLGYTSCGTTRDYMHSEGIYGWTPEIDGDGFWPTPSTIFDLVGENVRAMFYQSYIAGAYLDVQSHTQIGDATPGSSFELVVEVKNVGVGATANIVSVILEASVPGVTVSTASSYGTIAARARKDNSANPFTISLNPSFSETSFTLTASTYHDGVLNEVKEIPVLIGNSTPMFEDDAEGGTVAWLSYGQGINWGTITDDSYSGNFSFGDSNGGNAENNSLNYFELDQVFDLTQTFTPVVTFAAKWSLATPDYAAFQISTDGGDSWDDLRVFNNNQDWSNRVIVLEEYLVFSDVRFRFKMFTNNSLPADGFYFDDFRIVDYDTDILPVSELPGTEISVVPNPFQTAIILRFPADMVATISIVELLDVTGRNMGAKIFQQSESIEVQELHVLHSGVYFLKVRDKANRVVMVKKMIKM